ncbi:MAG: sulfurtransferase TusA family protein [Actinomycetota bacterium]
MTAPVVDALGTYCPAPLRLLRRALARVAPGDEVVLLADDPLIEVDLAAWCHEHGHELVSLVRDEDAYRGVVRRGATVGVDASGGVT